MAKVKFIRGFRGVETGEVHYQAGDVAEVDDIWLERLIQDKRAVVVYEPKPKRQYKRKVKKEVKDGSRS